MKRRLQLGGLLIIVFCVFCLLGQVIRPISKKALIDVFKMHSKSPSKPTLKAEKISVLKTPTLTQVRSPYENVKTLENLEKSLVETSNFIREKDRNRVFHESGIDTRVLFLESVNVIKKPYAFPFNRGEIKKRILALHFLELTQQLNHEMCMEVLNNVVESYLKSLVEVKKALLWDVYELGIVCAKMNLNGVKQLQEDLLDKTLQEQLGLALKKAGHFF